MDKPKKIETWHKILLVFLAITFLLVIIIYITLQVFLSRPIKEMPVNQPASSADKSLEGIKKLP